MMIFALIIVLLFLWIDNERLHKEIKDLKAKNNINFCPNCGMNLKYNKTKVQENIKTPENIPETVITNIDPPKERSKSNEKEIKNSIILTVGAILVVIAAIIFLTTTWNTSLNIIKTIVIILMFFVFIGFSYIADTYLNVKQTSKIFLYIAYSYLPLVFISISLFELLGNYLSFYGPGKYVYLSISSIILSVIYYDHMKNNNDLFFAIGSYIFQIFSVILTVLIFTSNINGILVGISMYSLLFNYLYDNNKYYYTKDVHLKINQTITIAILVSTLFFLTSINNYIDIPFTLLLITIYWNFYYLLNKQSEEEIFKIVGPIILLFASYTIAKIINQGFIIYQTCMILGIAVSYLMDLFLYKKGTIATFIISSITFIFIYLYTFFEVNSIPSYILMIYYLLFIIEMKFDYKNDEDYNKAFNYMIPIALNIGLIDCTINMKLNSIIPFIILTVMFVSDNLLSNNDKKYFAPVSIPFTLSSYFMILFDNVINNKFLIPISLMTFIIYYSFYHLKDKKLYKLSAYIWTIITFFSIIYSFTTTGQELVFVLPIATIITYVLDNYYSKEKDKSYELLQTEFIISFISLMFYHNIYTVLLFIIITILYVYHNYNWQKPHTWNYIPLLTFNYYLIGSMINTNMELIKATSIIISIALLLILNTYNKKEYIGMSLLNSIIGIIYYQINRYFSVILLIVSAFIYKEKDEKRNDLYLSSIYILTTILVKFIIKDLELNKITVLNVGIYILPLMLITRTFLYKKYKEYTNIEYIGLVGINLIAICLYSSEIDGMLYVLLLLFLTVLGYNKKWETLFLTSITFIVINVFLLTRVFWLSIPWWIYILLVGFALITFAIRNEIEEKEKEPEKENSIDEIAKK